MTLSQAFRKAVYGIGQAITKAAYAIEYAVEVVSGEKALDDRGLDRPNSGFLATLCGAVVASTTGVLLFPLAGIFAVAAGIEGFLAPFQIQAAYVIGKDEHKNAKPAKRRALKK